MNQPGVDLGVLGVLPIRAAELDSPEAIAQWLGSAGASERSRQLSSMSRDKLAHFVALLDSDTGPELLGSVDPDLAARVAQSAGVAQAAGWLEALDPEQNTEFLDHYLDVRFDLSKVLFICTANQLDTIPAPLLDRMETIRLSGYITAEKLQIARNHLWPKLLERSGLERDRIQVEDSALTQIIEGYAREAGVRNLEKQLGRIVRKSAVKIVEGEAEGPIAVDKPDLERYLGKPPFRQETRMAGIGVVTGLAWTALGGATLNVEASLVHTKNRGFKLTGRLGEVMQESANIAYSYVSAHLEDYQADPKFFDEAFVHLHVPEGATPKDGPSAGITMATALLSLARGQQPSRPLAMTGELTLTGLVLPVGGIREKVIAARRAGLLEIILPEGNRGDAEELPDHIKEGLTLHFVEYLRQVVDLVFAPQPAS